MKILIHKNSKEHIEIISSGDEGNEKIGLDDFNCVSALWFLAEKYPDELIVWCDSKFYKDIDYNGIDTIFHHDLIMASYAIESDFISESIGYIDQMPFVNVNRGVKYGTWRMSADVGGIKGSTLLLFKKYYRNENNFQFLLNSIAKTGLENGLFCYSTPKFLKETSSLPTISSCSTSELFKFTYCHYSTIWTYVLFWCLMRYESKFPLLAFLKSFFHQKIFQLKIGLEKIKVQSFLKDGKSDEVDVIIPTLGRPKYLKLVLADLKNQSLVPKNVIVIEQNPDRNSISQLDEIIKSDWPFKLNHIFTHRLGVCHARNLGLKNISSDWVFLCDDDNRFGPEILQRSLEEIRRMGCGMISTAYRQEGEEIVFKNIKQWGTFGAGNSIIKRECIDSIFFSEAFEHGYGEDKDFGMQLRKKGCDIIYDPKIEIVHLKAPIGGFRFQPELKWKRDTIQPKPSPTIMLLALKYFTREQLYGFKTSLFLKFYKKQKIKNPFSYIEMMNKRWNRSLFWAKHLLKG